jgi:hypothetical protein
MIFELSITGLAVALSWGLSVSVWGILGGILAFLVFCSKSVPASLLLLFAIQILGFIRMCSGTHRDHHGLTLKWFCWVLMGWFIALFGSALGETPAGHGMLLAGLLMMIPNAATLFFFGEYFEKQTLRTFVDSILIPAFVAIEILLRVKAGVKSEFGSSIEIGLQILGGATLILSALVAFLRQRIKPLLTHWSLAWVGAALFLVPFDSETLSPIVFSAISILSVTSVSLLGLSAQLGPRHFAFSKLMASGLPGAVGFAALSFALKVALAANPLMTLPLFLGQLLLMMALVSCKPWEYATPVSSVAIRFWMVTAVQVISGCGLCWYSLGGLK